MFSNVFDYITSGESHGPGLTAIIKNLPAGLKLNLDKINSDLARRQKGYGRGGRMKIETDKVEILAGIRNGETTGSPLCLFIKNADYANWKGKEVEAFTRPRPGHADLTGGIKYQRKDLRDILERSSARETAIRVAVGAVAKQVLEAFDIQIASYVRVLGGIEVNTDSSTLKISDIQKKTETSEVRVLDSAKDSEIKKHIDEAKEEGNTLGGAFTVLCDGLPAALGSFTVPENKLDARLAFAFMSLQAIKAVEFGIGKEYAYLPGSQCHDEIYYTDEKGFYRKSNRAGGIEGGMTNGSRIELHAVMKPIPTLMQPLMSVDIATKEAFEAVKERSDVTAVPAAAVVGEALMAIEVVRVFMERYGQDNMTQIARNYENEQNLTASF